MQDVPCWSVTYILTANSGNHIIWGSTQQFGNDWKLVDVYIDAWCHVITCILQWPWSFYLRSFPGNKGLPSSISAKIHPALQISTRWMHNVNTCTMISSQSFTDLLHHTFAMSTWFLVHGSNAWIHSQSFEDPGYEQDRNHKSSSRNSRWSKCCLVSIIAKHERHDIWFTSCCHLPNHDGWRQLNAHTWDLSIRHINNESNHVDK